MTFTDRSHRPARPDLIEASLDQGQLFTLRRITEAFGLPPDRGAWVDIPGAALVFGALAVANYGASYGVSQRAAAVALGIEAATLRQMRRRVQHRRRTRLATECSSTPRAESLRSAA